MKEYLLQSGPYINYKQDKKHDYIIWSLILMIGYRILKDSVLPYLNDEITFYQFFLTPIFFLACILLSYGWYFLIEQYSKSTYLKEEYMIDGILLGLLLPTHTPVLFLIIASFIMIVLGRYFYLYKHFFAPALLAIITIIGLSIWFDICGSKILNTTSLLFEYKEIIQINSLSIYSILSGLVDNYISRTSPILCVGILLFLIFKKAIKWRIPIYFIGSYLILFVFCHLLSSVSIVEVFKWLGVGNLLFLVIFVTTDQRTIPITNGGQILFAILLAIFTYYGTYFFTPHLSFLFSNLILNLWVPLFDYFGNFYQLKYCSTEY